MIKLRIRGINQENNEHVDLTPDEYDYKEFDLYDKYYQINSNRVGFELKEDDNNCGVYHIGNFCLFNSNLSIKRNLISILKYLQDAFDIETRDFLSGTINADQFDGFGTILQEIGFKVEYAFTNSNTDNKIYTITCDLKKLKFSK